MVWTMLHELVSEPDVGKYHYNSVTKIYLYQYITVGYAMETM